MANLVDRATSDMLMGPDWAMNMELCDLINADPGHAKDAVKAVKKRLGNKNPKVQLLALTVLETMIKNCGDVVHHQVVSRDILHEMAKMGKKHKDLQVRDKVLYLLDSWQEAFGGPNGRYPQFFTVYDELRRSGVAFPRRTETAAPIFTPPQSQPIVNNFPSPERSPNRMPTRMDAPMPSDLPSLSLSEMQTARSGMEVLAEMLNALEPNNKQALKEELIVELVEQCRTAERRVMQLVNLTSDEELLRQGLSLNDDLKKVLTKYDALVSGRHLPKDSATAPPLLIDQEDSDDNLPQLSHRSTSRPKPQNSNSSNNSLLALPPPAQPQKSTAPVTAAPAVDLLSGDTLQDTPVNLPATNLQHSLASVLTHSQPGPSNFTTNSGGLSPAPIRPLYNSSQQSEQSFLSSNGMLPGQVSQDNNFSQVTQSAVQPLGQFHNSTYVAPWAQPAAVSIPQQGSLYDPQWSSTQSGGLSLSPRQQALIYGSEHPGAQASGSALSPQQSAMIYGPEQSFAQLQRPLHSLPYTTAIPEVSLPQSSHVYTSQPQIQQAQNQQNLNAPPYTYGSPAVLTQEGHGSIVQSTNSHLPAAPWSTDSTDYTTPYPESNSHYHGQATLPQSPVQAVDRQQLYYQQQLLASGQFAQAGLPSQMQNLSLQGGGAYFSAMQAPGFYMQQPSYPQKQGAPMRQTKPEDNLFKDLVDLAKTKKGGT